MSSEKTNKTDALLRLVWVILAMAPAVALVVATHKYYLPYPLREGWVMNTPLLESWYEGTFRVSTAFVTQAGYHVFVPLLLQTVLASLTGWNQGHEVAVNVLSGMMIYVAFVVSLRVIARRQGRRYPYWMLVPVSALVFSLSQSVNWNWASQIMTFLSLALAAFGLLFLTMENRWMRWLAAPVAGVLSSFSFGSGLLFWPVGFILLALVNDPRDKKTWWRSLLAWAALSAVVILVWYLSLQDTMLVGQDLRFMERAVVTIQLLPICLGNGLVRFHLPWAGVVGWLGLFSVGMFLILAIRNRTPRPLLAFPVSCIAYGMIMGTAIGWKWGLRYVEFIQEHNLGLYDVVSRYPTFANFFWVGLLLLGWVSVYTTAPVHAWSKALPGLLAVGITVLACVSGRTGYYEADERYRVHTPLIRNIVLNNAESLEKRLQFKGDEGIEALQIMRRYHLSIFRPEARAFWEATTCRSNWDWGQ